MLVRTSRRFAEMVTYCDLSVRKNLSQSSSAQCDILLLNFCKVFDDVPYARLFQELHHYGIHGDPSY